MSDSSLDPAPDAPSDPRPDDSGDRPWNAREIWTDPEIPVTDRKTGTVTFEMDPFPAVLGGPLCGTVHTSLSARSIPEDGVHVRLCRYERRLRNTIGNVGGTSGFVARGWEEREQVTMDDPIKNRKVVSVGPVLTLQWQTGRRMEVIPAADGETIDIPVFFDAVPADHPPSTTTPPDDLLLTDDRVVWTVEVLCNVAGIDYEGTPNAFRGDWFAYVEVPVLSPASAPRGAETQVSVDEYAQHEKTYEADRPRSDAIDLRRRGSGRLEVYVDSQTQPVVWSSAVAAGLFGVAVGAFAYWAAINGGILNPVTLGAGLMAVLFLVGAVRGVVSPKVTPSSQVTVGQDGTNVQVGDEYKTWFSPYLEALWPYLEALRPDKNKNTDPLLVSGGFVPHADLKEVRVELRPEPANASSKDGLSASEKEELPDELSDWPDTALRKIPKKRDHSYPSILANVCDLVLVADGPDGEERLLAARCPDTLEAAWLAEQIEDCARQFLEESSPTGAPSTGDSAVDADTSPERGTADSGDVPTGDEATAPETASEEGATRDESHGGSEEASDRQTSRRKEQANSREDEGTVRCDTCHSVVDESASTCPACGADLDSWGLF